MGLGGFSLICVVLSCFILSSFYGAFWGWYSIISMVSMSEKYLGWKDVSGVRVFIFVYCLWVLWG